VGCGNPVSSGPGPAVDLYIVAFDAPARGRYRDRSTKAVERIASQLLENRLVSRYIRRIAYVDAGAEGGDLSFTARFSFGAGLSAQRAADGYSGYPALSSCGTRPSAVSAGSVILPVGFAISHASASNSSRAGIRSVGTERA
jgi:hypothetical protein